MPLLTIPSGNVASAIGGGYEVANSCRFNDDDNSKMVVTPSSSGTNAGKKYTLSAWVKLGNIGVDKTIWSCSSDTYIYISGAGVITCNFRRNGSTNYEYGSSRKLRDPSAWYHIVLRVDTTDSTDADKVQVYVNNQEDTPATTTYQNMADDYETGANVSGVEQRIGVYSDGSLDFDGYMCELMMVDNQSLAPTEFGEYDEDTPTVWKPKDISGISVGTNGYYLDFEDSSNLGNNAAGSGSADLTETNLAATDQSLDTCTLNGCTLNPLDVNPASAGDTFSEGNLKLATNSNSNAAGSRSTFAFTKGKWYVESKYTSSTAWNGVMATDTTITGSMTTGTIAWYQGRTLYVDGSNSGTWGSAVSAGDIVGIALDMDNSRVTISQGGQWWGGSSFNQSQPHTFQNLTSGYDTWSFLCRSGSATSTSEWNFGSPPFAISSSNSDANGYGNMEYTVPTDYYIPNSANLAEFG